MTTSQETCGICGSLAKLVRERERMQMGSRSATVEVERYRCDSCDETFVTPDQMRTNQRALAAQLRSQEGLLEPERVRSIREHLGLTQAEFERLLQTGSKTVIRWEKGTVFQTKAADLLMRVVEAVPAAYEFLAIRSGLLAPSFADANEPATKESHIHYGVRRTTEAALAARLVVQPNDFLRRAATVKSIVPSRETVVPRIPEKALR